MSRHWYMLTATDITTKYQRHTDNPMSKKGKKTGYINNKKQASITGKWLAVNVALALVLIIVGIGVLFWMGQQSGQQQVSAPSTGMPEQGQTAPDFTLTSLSGEAVNLSDYEGQVVLVNMWATWCPPCKAEMPTIHDYYKAHKDDGFVVLAINSQEEASNVNSFIQAAGFTFPVLLDSRAEVMSQYNVRGLPTTFIIDRDGNVQHTHSGLITKEQLESYIDPLL
jgi:cytochrome c biogenesis protein CcmG/thiol:disulfide interchange protein DsbE